MPTAASPTGVDGVIDESGFAKRGDHGAGVARQHNGRLGKRGNRQVGVTSGGSALLDHRAYLPEDWCENTRACRDRREEVHIPGSASLPAKPRAAAGSIRQGMALDVVSLDWVAAEVAYGQNGEFLDEAERRGLRYVAEVTVGRTAWTEDPASCLPACSGRGRVPTTPSRESVASVAAAASRPGAESRRVLNLGQGAKGPSAHVSTAIRARAVRRGEAGPPIWSLARRPLERVVNFSPVPGVV